MFGLLFFLLKLNRCISSEQVMYSSLSFFDLCLLLAHVGGQIVVPPSRPSARADGGLQEVPGSQ